MPAYLKKQKNTEKHAPKKRGGKRKRKRKQRKRGERKQKEVKRPLFGADPVDFYVRSKSLPSLNVLGLDSLSYLIIFILLSL